MNLHSTMRAPSWTVTGPPPLLSEQPFSPPQRGPPLEARFVVLAVAARHTIRLANRRDISVSLAARRVQLCSSRSVDVSCRSHALRGGTAWPEPDSRHQRNAGQNDQQACHRARSYVFMQK